MKSTVFQPIGAPNVTCSGSALLGFPEAILRPVGAIHDFHGLQRASKVNQNTAGVAFGNLQVVSNLAQHNF